MNSHIESLERPKEEVLKAHVKNLPEKEMLEKVVLEKRKRKLLEKYVNNLVPREEE